MIGSLPQYRDLNGGDEFPSLHLDRGYDSAKTRDLLDVLGFEPHIAVKGAPAPIQAGRSTVPHPTPTARNGPERCRKPGADH
jgi:hypothetical protein